ncbi:MAG: lactate utilization protein [Candidatus Bipolaricaulis sp.]|nr:lactate utilization protein [Candidatus Bipolaricaulis sp.]MDD5646423.1 lactate utilization protein [Candidatus Bipolaricaulis sp.]
MNRQLTSTCDRLQHNGFHAVTVADAAAARGAVLDLVPPGSAVGIGDSATLRQIGALEALEQQGSVVVDLFSRRISEQTNTGQIRQDRRKHIARLAMRCTFFLTGTNAVTESGALVNIDSYGNRVAGMICGPSEVVLVAGRNKIVPDVDAALVRLRNVIVPAHAQAKWKNTPCAVAGRCSNCDSPERLCGVTTIIERAPGYLDAAHVILVDEDLGLGWDPAWPADRIARIRSGYEAQTWLKLGSRKPAGG